MNELVLSSCKKGKLYKIKYIKTENKELSHQLSNLGFLENEKIEIKFSNYGQKSIIVKVMNIGYAIDKLVAEQIVVSEVTNE